MDRIGHVVHGERATRTALVDVMQPHEVVDDQLAAALEQVGQRHLAVRALEHVVLVDGHRGKCAPLLGQRGELPAGGLLLGQQVLARRQPILARRGMRDFHFDSFPQPY
jgi:hypothetical protein